MDDFNRHLAEHREELEQEPGSRPAKRRLAASLRTLLDTLNATQATSEELLAFASHVDEAAARFEARLPEEGDGRAATGMEDFFERGPIAGLANPLAPPATFERDDEARIVHGTVTFGNAFEGGPGIVHGGFLASVLDEALGVATTFSGDPALTGELTVRYHRATPTRQPLRIEARCDGREGRRVHLSGELYLGDEVCVSAKGLFIAIVYDKFVELNEERAKRSSEGA